MSSTKEDYAALKAAGLCPRCKEDREDANRVLCRHCRKQVTDSAARWREKNRARDNEKCARYREKKLLEGRCTQCPRKALPGRRWCRVCTEGNRTLRAQGEQPRQVTCSTCDGRLPPARHDRRNCPLDLEIQKAEIAASRPGGW